MNSKPKAPSIPIGEVLSWEDWLKGRRWRRQLGSRIAPEVIRRKTSSSDRRLRKLFHGRRDLPCTPRGKLWAVLSSQQPCHECRFIDINRD